MSAIATHRAMEVEDDDYESVESSYEHPYMNYEPVEESYNYPYMNFEPAKDSDDHSYLFMNPLSAEHESQRQGLQNSHSLEKKKTRRYDGRNWKRYMIIWMVLLLGTILAAAVYTSLLHCRINALSAQLELLNTVTVINITNCLCL